VQLKSIQYVRAIAALMVVFYHVTIYLKRMKGDASLHDIFGGSPGLYGVIAFFIVTGYLMADIAPKYRPSTFLMHRLLRIYPTYWLCVLLAGVFYVGLWLASAPNSDYIPNLQAMLLANGFSRDLLRLTLAPIVFNDYPLGIEWTLLYETSFYVIVFLMALAGKLKYLPYLGVGWLAMIVLAILKFPESQVAYTQPSLLTLPFFAINTAFILGILGQRLQAKVEPVSAIVVGVLIVAFAEVFKSSFDLLQICVGLFGIVVGLIALERKGKLPDVPALRKLGDWSYVLYLVHLTVILGVFKLLNASSGILLITVMAVTILVSAVLGQLDMACYRKLKGLCDGAAPRFHHVLAAGFVAVFFTAALLGLK
jgi:exopolysaccharide production protein ExoZ